MDEPGEESLDGSSIKPVSSLRSHFEQMAHSQVNSAPRAASPRPASSSNSSSMLATMKPTNNSETVLSIQGTNGPRGREREAVDVGGFRPLRPNGAAGYSPSPTRGFPLKQVSLHPPEVTVQPPLSPPKAKPVNLTLSSAATYLSTDTATSSPSGSSSPRHFRIPSRPNTPHLEPKKPTSLPSSQPPSPPPPRRSGELTRSPSFRGLPPPINRAEKPKMVPKPSSLIFHTESTTLAPGPRHQIDVPSPFSTPPSSGGSQEHESGRPELLPNRPARTKTPQPNASISQNHYEPPQMHHSITSQQKFHELQGTISTAVIDEQRPALPTRPNLEASKPKDLAQNSMLPPPRPSSEKKRTPLISAATLGNTDASSTPPKRVVSTPSSHQQPPLRSHGRSMTVDRTSEKAPIQFRTPAVDLVSRPETQASEEPATSTSMISEYPDFANSNRRPPLFQQGVREVPTKYETRIFDVCGEFVCTSGHLTRVWSLLDGENIMSLAHTEGVKIISVAFKPTVDVNDEGTRLWLGNNIGDIMEVDVITQSVIASKSNAHTRREIIRMYRYLNQMWTLDDGGTLHIWAPDSTGVPSLSNPFQSFRVPKGHTFSLIAGDELWYAAGKEIRVFVPTLDGSTQFQVLQRPLSQPNTGDVASGTTLNTHPDLVYLGHVDGKISIYSRRDYACLGVVSISMYKITSLAGVNGDLWAGFSTGSIHVYDTTKTPWVVKKDWRAHDDPLIGLNSDRSSFWKLDRAQVISLGQDSMIRIWDGLLQADWIETQMQSQEHQFCDFTKVNTLVMTWNAGASTPYHLQHSKEDSVFIRDMLQRSNSPDILVFAFQELVDLEDKKTTARSIFKSKKKDHSEAEHMSHQYRDWRDFLTRCLDDYLRDDLYHLLHASHLVGLFTCIFVKAPLRERIRTKTISGVEVKRGMGGLHGNKGALIIRFILDDTSMCFINCHLAAGQTQTKDRNTDITMILESSVLPPERDLSVRQDSFVGGGDGTMILDHELCILNGDLNYRIDTMSRDTVISAVKAQNLEKLLARDQLLASRRKNPWFKLRAFHELPITFDPTYKYDVGTDNYDTSEKKRSPAWCDRILYRGRDRINQLDYRRHEVRVSDHRPVTAEFEMLAKKVLPQKRILKWEECQTRLIELKERLGHEARQDYIMHVLGFDAASCKTLMAKRGKNR